MLLPLLLGGEISANDAGVKRNIAIALHLVDEGMEHVDRWAESPTDADVEAGHFRDACLRRLAARDALRPTGIENPAISAAFAQTVHASRLYGDLLDRILKPIPEGYDGDWDRDLFETQAAFHKARIELQAWKSSNDENNAFDLRDRIERAEHRLAGCADVLSAEEHERKKTAWKAWASVRERQANEEAAKRVAAAADLQRKAREALPASYESVTAWHRNFYSPRMLPLKRILGRLLMVDRNRRSQSLSTACGEIFSTTETLLADRKLLSGTPAIDQSVAKMLKSFKAASESCLSSDLKTFNTAYQLGEQHLQAVAIALEPFKLVP